MLRRRRLLQALASLLALPAGLAAGATVLGPAAAAPGRGFRLVNGWVLTERDVAAIAALDRGPA